MSNCSLIEKKIDAAILLKINLKMQLYALKIWNVIDFPYFWQLLKITANLIIWQRCKMPLAYGVELHLLN